MMLMFTDFFVRGGTYGDGESCIDVFAFINDRRPSREMDRRDMLSLASNF